MAATNPNSFERIFSRADLFRGKSLQALIWGVLASLALCVLLFDLFLIVDLLVTRGQLDPSDAGPFRSTVLLEQAAAGPAAQSASLRIPGGMSPTVWRLRDKPIVGSLLVHAYRRIAWLRESDRCLAVLILCGFIVACLRGLFLWCAEKASAGTGLDVATRLRRTLHRQTLRLGPGDLTDPEGAQVIRLFTQEVEQVRSGVQTWILRLGRDPAQLAFLLILALVVDWRVALQCLILLGGCWYLVQRQRARLTAVNKIEESRAEVRLRLLAEGLRKTRIVRGYGMEEFEHEQFRRHLEKFRANVLKVLNTQHYLRLAVEFLALACLAVVIFLVGNKVLEPPEIPYSLPFASALLMLAIVAGLPGPLIGLWDLQQLRRKASLAADHVFRYLNQTPAVSQAVGAKFLEPLTHTATFEAVSYSLPSKRKLLDGLDLTLTAGETVAIVSFDPLEAQALTCLLPRFIEPQSGRILFDGEDIAWGTLESLRAETVYVGGNDPFFTGTVAENIICGQSTYTLPEVTEAAKTAHAHNFILKLPQGYETVIGEHGEQLDAGQGFRLGLARAVLRDPAVMIIEEPSDVLDEDTKSLLDDSYNRILKGRTVFFLPNRLSTLRRADSVVFLHHGKVESQGAYQDLVKNSSLFRHWEYMHFNQFRRELEPVAAR